MDDFIEGVSSHSAKCGHRMICISRSTNLGAYVKEVWKCTGCQEEMELTNCEMVKTTVVERERKYSRKQPSINIQLASGFVAGVNMNNTINFVSTQLSIKMSNYRNLSHANHKVRKAISKTAKDRLLENKREHVALTRSGEGYKGDLVWVKDGVSHSTSIGATSIDGAACTSSYGHKHNRGRRSQRLN